MIPQFLVAGALALVGAAVHGGAGEILVLRKLFSGPLPSSRFGGADATRVMIRVTWHVVTFTFATLGTGLATCGFLGPGEACRGIGLLAAISFTGFLGLAVAIVLQRPRSGIRHRGPLVFLLVAGLAWWGVLA
jgi:hypothetical protein